VTDTIDARSHLDRIAAALESIAAQLAVIAVNTAAPPVSAPVQASGPGMYRTVASRDNQASR
jgi:hypothetical protein